MADSAREYTDAELKAMEDYLTGIYAQAEKDLQKKFEKYLADFARLEMQNQKKVDAGEMSQEEFDEWRKNKLLYGTHWTKLIKQVQNEMSQCNQTALDYVNGKVPQIFAVNYNQLAEVIDNSPVGGYTFELVNADTIKNLATGNEIILPPRKNMDIPKDQLWNAKLVNAQIMQGILQGESIPKMAARMANVCNSNLKAATRTARTMTTAAENSGRQSSINRATADGIILIKEWLATNDERTRDSHVAVNHERVRCDASTEKTKLFSNGLAFPADWHGKPSEVYNCRCTLITKYAGVDSKLLKAAIKRQDQLEKAVVEPDNKSFTDRVNECRERYNQSNSDAERDKAIQDAGNEMRLRLTSELNSINSQIEAIQKEYGAKIDEINSKIEKLEAEYQKLLADMSDELKNGDEFNPFEFLLAQATGELGENQDKSKALVKEINRLYEQSRKATIERYRKISELQSKSSEVAKMILKEIRNCGTDTPLKNFAKPYKRSDTDKEMVNAIFNALSDYPTEWLDVVSKNEPLKIGQSLRGFYNDGIGIIMLNPDLNYQRTAYHELAHYFEYNISNLLSAEKTFYERRTENEPLVHLGAGYGGDEMTRVDKFIHKYMGKDYGGEAYELASKGFEAFFTNPEELLEDEDYANFIMGVLALC